VPELFGDQSLKARF